MRKGICREHGLQCYNFLLFVDSSNKNIYKKFKKIDSIIDLTKNFSWEQNNDGIFTPKSNELISKKIYNYILN